MGMGMGNGDGEWGMRIRIGMGDGEWGWGWGWDGCITGSSPSLLCILYLPHAAQAGGTAMARPGFVSRRCAFAAATLLLTACGAADTGGPDTGDETARAEPLAGGEDDGTATEADNANAPPVKLPYENTFKVAKFLDTRRFVVPEGTRVSVHVLATARWNAPSRCQGRKFVISLSKGTEGEISDRIFPTDGSLEAGSWQNVKDGTYHVHVYRESPDSTECEYAVVFPT
jgi:hypothetical protein